MENSKSCLRLGVIDIEKKISHGIWLIGNNYFSITVRLETYFFYLNGAIYVHTSFSQHPFLRTYSFLPLPLLLLPFLKQGTVQTTTLGVRSTDLSCLTANIAKIGIIIGSCGTIIARRDATPFIRWVSRSSEWLDTGSRFRCSNKLGVFGEHVLQRNDEWAVITIRSKRVGKLIPRLGSLFYFNYSSGIETGGIEGAPRRVFVLFDIAVR